MPGVFGAFFRDNQCNLSALLGNMGDSMNHNSQSIIEMNIDEENNYGAGRVSIGVLNKIAQPVKSLDKTCLTIFHGELFGNTSGLSDPEYVLDQYMKKGDVFVNDLDGIFHFFVYDNSLNEIKLFSDKFGLYPLYYSATGESLIFAGEVKALLKYDNIDLSQDFESFGDFFHFGQILGQKTLFKNIKLLPPAAILKFNIHDCSLRLKKYWQLESLFALNGNYKNKISMTAVDSLIDSIRQNTGNTANLGLSLSGGLDSRAILAGLQGKSRGLSTYTLGLEGCADQKLAQKMADIAKTEHEFIILDQIYISNFENMARDMIKFSDGMYHPHESTEMLALEYFKNAGFKILLRGHGGEIAKAGLAYPVMVRPGVSTFKNSKQILNYIYNQTNLVTRDIDKNKLFLLEYAELFKETPLKSLNDSCLLASQKFAPEDVCIFYYINEHIRRQVVASLDIFRTQIEIRLPFVSEKFLQKLLMLPVSERFSGEIHYKLVEKCMPSLLKVKNSNTGAPMDAGPARLFITDKFNSLLKKLNVQGFRHYTRFQDWYRKGFRQRNEKFIFSDQTASRGLYNMDYLKNIYTLHITGKKDYGHFIGTLIGLEMWFRDFIDP